MLIDVTPLTLGVETDGGVFSEVLPRGSAVPWQVRPKDELMDGWYTYLVLNRYMI